MGPRFRVSSERLEPGIEPTTPGLEGEKLNHYTTEASVSCLSYSIEDPQHRILWRDKQNCFLNYHWMSIRGLLFKFVDFSHCSFNIAFIQY